MDAEEGQDEYEKDGFIVDEEEELEEEEERESNDEEAKARKKKRKKRSEENDELDEDDYELLRRHKKAKKKKAPRKAPEISSFALHEAQDIFGDVSALLDARHQQELEAQKAEMDVEEDEDGFGRRKPSKLLEKQFEPSLLEEKFMTEKDDQIRDTDVAERLQLWEEVVGSFPPAETASREALWIYEHAFGRDAFWKIPELESLARLDKKDVVNQIANVLHLLHEEKLEALQRLPTNSSRH